MQIKSDNANIIYLILDGSKTTNKETFLVEIVDLLKFPDYYDEFDNNYIFKWDWDDLSKHLKEVVKFWENENPEYIEPVSDEQGVIPSNLIVKVIWLDPLDFSEYNPDDFKTAINILKEITIDKDNILDFVLASSINAIDI